MTPKAREALPNHQHAYGKKFKAGPLRLASESRRTRIKHSLALHRAANRSLAATATAESSWNRFKATQPGCFSI
ncbi:hypothetical protein [Hymenobacter coccineus]|uniref:Uncharacterized protein n=1 Tax=Hymenobacter coccineus TaxID=1908235 RepID=A0A1G1SSH0_9BACT|nr:hypothetical protein [Hymenobacter coccineus]OGX81555.1 hypothetical protein BEN49_15400 [Hymenobacter coccineus]